MTMLHYSGGRRTSGYSVLAEDFSSTERETLSCVHCQMIWAVQPGSGHNRGFCFLCNGPTCGKQNCVESCTPWEKQIEEIEAKDRFWRRLNGMK